MSILGKRRLNHNHYDGDMKRITYDVLYIIARNRLFITNNSDLITEMQFQISDDICNYFDLNNCTINIKININLKQFEIECIFPCGYLHNINISFNDLIN